MCICISISDVSGHRSLPIPAVLSQGQCGNVWRQAVTTWKDGATGT